MICELHLNKLLMGVVLKKRKKKEQPCGQMLMTEEVGYSWESILLTLLNRFFNTWVLVFYTLTQDAQSDLEVTVFSRAEAMFNSLFLGTRII